MGSQGYFSSMANLGLISTLLIASILVQTAFTAEPAIGTENEFEVCWERCFQMIDEDAALKKYRPAFFEFYDMGMEARRLKNMRSVNGTTILLDSTLSQWHDSTTNLDLEEYEKAENIWAFQMNLATITTMMQGNDDGKNPLSIVQFNEKSAWTCGQFTCLDMCEAATIFNDSATYLTPIQLNATSYKDANIEPACRLGYENLHDNSESFCAAEIDREMAITIVNSDFDSNVHESDEWDDYSPCDEHFDTRYAIGTHAADYHELKEWSSLDAHPTYIKDSQYTQEAAEILKMCMMERCCSTASIITPSTTCVITTDHFGETAETFSDHPNHI